MMFRIGQKIVCVEGWVAEPGFGYGDEIGPTEGTIYTIRHLGVGLNKLHPDNLQVRLVEVKNDERHYAGGLYEPAFRATRFRPVVDRKTDISIFQRMLTPSRQKEGAR